MNPSLIEKARARRLNALRYIEERAAAGIARSDRDISNIFKFRDRNSGMGDVIAFHSHR